MPRPAPEQGEGERPDADLKGNPELSHPPGPIHLLPGTLETRELRQHYAGIALREIVRWQVENKLGGQESLAASWSFRYADRMVEEARKDPRSGATLVRGRQEPVFEEIAPPPGLPASPVGPIADDAMQALGQPAS